MLGVGEPREPEIQPRLALVLAGAVDVARGEIVLVRLAVSVDAADMTVSEHELRLGMLRYPP